MQLFVNSIDDGDDDDDTCAGNDDDDDEWLSSATSASMSGSTGLMHLCVNDNMGRKVVEW